MIPPYSRLRGCDSGMTPIMNPDIINNIPTDAIIIEPRYLDIFAIFMLFCFLLHEYAEAWYLHTPRLYTVFDWTLIKQIERLYLC